MPCGCAHTRMSLSSTTTSDSRRSPKPPDSRVNLGVSRFSGRLDRAGFRRDSAGDPLQMPPYADQGVSSTTIWAMTQSSPGPIWLTASRTTQSSERLLMRLPVSELVAPDLAEDFANLGRASSRAARVSSDESRASGSNAYLYALATDRGRRTRTWDHPGTRRSRSPCRAGCRRPRRPGRTDSVWSVRSSRREGSSSWRH
jgi:hypothetical protein